MDTKKNHKEHKVLFVNTITNAPHFVSFVHPLRSLWLKHYITIG